MSDEYHTPKPMPGDLLDKLKEIGVNKIELRFSGGSDEGYLEASVTETADGAAICKKSRNYWDKETDNAKTFRYGCIPGELEEEVTEWGYRTYSYSGAGCGFDYGDNYVYDLVNKTVTHDYWEHQKHSTEYGECKFEDCPDDEKDEADGKFDEAFTKNNG